MKLKQIYWNTVYFWLLIFAPCASFCPGIATTLSKLNGNYVNTSWFSVILFDCTQFVYFLISMYFIRKLRQKNANTAVLFRQIKWYITISLLIQYNFLMHIFITDYVWGCTFLFLILIVFLLDIKMFVINIAAYLVSFALAHILHAQQHLPGNPEHAFSSLCFRTVVLILCCVFLVVINYYIEKFMQRAQMENEENQFLMEKQLEYYQHLDIMDKELRKFRHDIQNHFLCMQKLIENGKQSELKQYFQDLINTYPENDRLYFSGNLIIDSILNYNLAHDCKDNIRPVVYGKLPQVDAVSDMDLCTVFSNMLSNAIKGANASTEEKPSLTIHFQHGDKYFSITIQNSSCATAACSDKTLQKADRNHGHGIHQIEEVTKKYQGIFEQKQENGLFTMQVCLPIFETEELHNL